MVHGPFCHAVIKKQVLFPFFMRTRPKFITAMPQLLLLFNYSYAAFTLPLLTFLRITNRR